MRIIDLLNKIAKGYDLPEKIIYKNDLYILDKNIDSYWNYENKIWLESKLYGHVLNDNVEIIEDKEDNEIKKLEATLEYCEGGNHIAKVPNNEQLMFKINEIIDVINKMRNTDEYEDEYE